MSNIRIGLAQVDIVWMDKKINLGKIGQLASAAKNAGCDWLIFPEMSTTGFSMDTDFTVEALRAETFKSIAASARKNSVGIIAGYPVFESEIGDKVKNAAVVVDQSGQLITHYFKIHPFSHANEDKYFSSGDEVKVFSFGDFKASVFICYDLRFPEIFRSAARVTDCFIVIANWPKCREAHWLALLNARAIENQAFVIGVNRQGVDGNGIEYSGCSGVWNPLGERLRASLIVDELMVFDVDFSQVAQIRESFSFLKDAMYIEKSVQVLID